MAPKESRVEIRDLTLMWGGESLHTKEHTANDLSYVIASIGREAIVRSIEANYAHAIEQNPDTTVSRPSVHAITLGSDRRTVLTSFGQHNRTSLSRSVIELQPAFRSYWQTVLDNGFMPEVRRFTGSQTHETIALLLRNLNTDTEPITPLDHLPRALGFLEPAATADIKRQLAESLSNNTPETFQALWQKLENENEAAVDRQVQSFGESVLPAAQIGRIVAMANVRAELRGEDYLLGEDGYLADLVDAEEGAYRYGLGEVSDLLKAEISRVKSTIHS